MYGLLAGLKLSFVKDSNHLIYDAVTYGNYLTWRFVGTCYLYLQYVVKSLSICMALYPRGLTPHQRSCENPLTKH